MIDQLKKIKSIYVLIGILILLIAVVFKFSPWQYAKQSGKLISWDITSYYAYLPATFIEDDIELNFVDQDSSFYHEQQMYWPEEASNGGKVIKTTMGLSILYSPFFFIANSLDDDSTNTRGFSETFEFWLVISCLFYTIIGAVLLRLYLLQHFPDWSVSITLLVLYFGTNLFYYITIEPLMPHAYSFFLIALFLFLTDKWHQTPNLIYAIALGATFGLTLLVRPVNGLILLFFVGYNIQTIDQFKERVKFFLSEYKSVLLFACFSFLILLPQLLYWHKITGQFFFNSYPGERFFFTNPHLIDGLFSYRKGWLIYTPIMLLGLIGLFINTKNRMSTLFVIIPSLYLMFSWWNWWYGGSFGCRPVIDFYPILAIGIATVLVKFTDINWSKYLVLTIVPLLVLFNLFQTLQKKSDAIHWEAMTKEAYWHNFLHRYPQEGLDSKLKHPDVEAAKKGLDEY